MSAVADAEASHQYVVIEGKVMEMRKGKYSRLLGAVAAVEALALGDALCR